MIICGKNSLRFKLSIHFNFITTILLGRCSRRQQIKFTSQRLLRFCQKRVAIIIIISLFNVDTKNKVKNYNKKEIIAQINYNILNGSTWLIHVKILNDVHLLTQCWQRTFANVNTPQNKSPHWMSKCHIGR